MRYRCLTNWQLPYAGHIQPIRQRNSSPTKNPLKPETVLASSRDIKIWPKSSVTHVRNPSCKASLEPSLAVASTNLWSLGLDSFPFANSQALLTPCSSWGYAGFDAFVTEIPLSRTYSPPASSLRMRLVYWLPAYPFTRLIHVTAPWIEALGLELF